MRKFLIVAGVFIFGLAVGFFLNELVFTGEVVFSEDVFGEYSYTRAICEENKCMDVVVYCSNGKVERIEPIFYFVENSEDWEDPRNVTGFCE